MIWGNQNLAKVHNVNVFMICFSTMVLCFSLLDDTVKRKQSTGAENPDKETQQDADLSKQGVVLCLL